METSMIARIVLVWLLLPGSLKMSIAKAQSFPFEQLKGIYWGMKLDNLRNIRPDGELKTVRGMQLYAIRDSLWSNPAGFAFSFSKRDTALSTVTVLLMREAPSDHFAQLSKQLAAHLSAHHGNPDSEKRILGQTAMKWNSTESKILFIATNDALNVVYSRRDK
jgi:hypothetical protein